MTRSPSEQSKIRFRVRMSLGLLFISLLFPAFLQNAYATNSGQKIQFKVDTYAVAEKAGSVTLRVIRTGGSFDTVTGVTYCTCEDSALAPEDFIHSPGTLIFYKDEQEKTITVPIVDDKIKENDEQFFVLLKSTTGDASLGDRKLATVIINDDDDNNNNVETSLRQSSPTPSSTLSSPKAEISLFPVIAATPIPEITASPTPTPKASADEPTKGLFLKDSASVRMPNTATPWYNYIIVGSLLVLLSGTMLYRRMAAFRSE